jgi:hypothetical protein
MNLGNIAAVCRTNMYSEWVSLRLVMNDGVVTAWVIYLFNVSANENTVIIR